MDTLEIIQDELQTIISVSKSTALSDGVLSEDEVALLELLEQQLHEIEDELTPIVSLMPSDLSEIEIRERVRKLAQDIIPKLSAKARQDGKITSDEKAILDQVTDRII